MESTQVSIDGQMVNRMWYIHKGKLFDLENWGNSDTCYKVDGPWSYYAKWNESATEG